MSVIVLLIACSAVVALFFLGAYIWAARNGQYDDDYTPSVRMLFDDEAPADPEPDTPKTN
jgi:cbb3-type cytochrome oxidase maturation protein